MRREKQLTYKLLFKKTFITVILALSLTLFSCGERTENGGGDGDDTAPTVTADFSYIRATASYSVSFYNLSKSSEADIVKYFWEFGDDNNSQDKDPKHSYGKSGYFKVALTVTDNASNSAKTERDIFITKDVVSAGKKTSYILSSRDNETYAFGNNGYGELGVGDTNNYLLPTKMLKDMIMTELKSVSAGATHSVLYDNHNYLYTSGNNEHGQLGSKDNISSVTRLTPINIPSTSPIVNISSRGEHTLVLDEAGDIYAFGRNDKGQLGNNQVGSIIKGDIAYSPTAVKVLTTNIPKDEKVIRVAAAKTHSLALTDKGNVYAWGANNLGQLGTSKIKDNNTSLIPISIEKSPELQKLKIIQIEANENRSFAITSDGSVYAWGDRVIDQLKDTKTATVIKRGEIPKNVKIIQITSGRFFTLLLGDDYKLYSYGYNDYGELANGVAGTPNYTSKAILNGELPDGVNIVYISAGDSHAVAVGDDGRFYSWGRGLNGQLGTGNTDNSSLPTLIKNIER